MKRLLSFLFSLLLLAFINGCSKDNSIEPKQETDAEKSKLYTSVIGKWVLETSPNQRTTSENAFLEFLSDSTYIVYNISETLVQGNFNATSGTSISLENFGTLSDIKFTRNKIGFKLTYSNKTLTVSASKAAAVDATGQTQLLSHLWSLTVDEDGKEILGNTNNNWDKEITKATLRFTAAGSYITCLYSGDELLYADVFNWKWHSTKSDRIVYWSESEPVNEEVNVSIIRELTATTLKVSDYGEDEVWSNFTFKRLD
jgi:hypothetical protein